MKTADNADEFLDCADDFCLGELETEQSHPDTLDLSDWCESDLPRAIAALKLVDEKALGILADKLMPGERLTGAIRQTWANGGRVFLAGCGATGRLSLALETFCREGLVAESLRNKVAAFMAGGDAALIRSIEGFEDFPSYGARQLDELGFGEKDLLIASTEGGETPWVIGATERAAEASRHTPWFCYCNPDDLLRAKVERSRRVLDNPSIEKWNLAVGPMAIAGSTRMQASTVLQYAIGLALEFAASESNDTQQFSDRLSHFRNWIDAHSWDFLAPFIQRETEIYQNRDRVLYITEEFGVTVLTDTTERSPTFSLPVFENYANGQPNSPLSLCYLSLPEATRSDMAWRRLLRREPRCLSWPPELPFTRLQTLLGYDISAHAANNRAHACGDARHHCFSIDEVDGAVVWSLDRLAAEAIAKGLPFLEKQILLKMLLNTHSTLVMGCLGRYAGNVMTYVKPSNNKLIDRAIRYVQTLHCKAAGETPDYALVCRELFRQRETLRADEPIVLKTLSAIA
ncbi:MAG: hypothetical protein ACQKBV_07975 [Puniceicoccales bacterium]